MKDFRWVTGKPIEAITNTTHKYRKWVFTLGVCAIPALFACLPTSCIPMYATWRIPQNDGFTYSQAIGPASQRFSGFWWSDTRTVLLLE
jgi:hypothetical protein